MEGTNPSWHIYIAQLDFSEIGKTKMQVFQEMKECGIVLNLHYIPVHEQPYYEELGFCTGDFPHSERYYSKAFTLPLYYGFTEEQQDRVVDSLRDIISAC